METRRRRRRRNSDEEEIKPKRVRGSRSSETKDVVVVNSTPAKVPTALEAHDLESTLRLQNYPDFHSMLDEKSLANVIGACYGATRERVERMIQDPRVTIGELQAIVLSTDAIDSESNSRLRSKEYSDTRLFGKPKETIEHRGNIDSKLIVETKQKQSFEDFLATATREQLDKLEEANAMFVDVKKVNVDGSDD